MNNLSSKVGAIDALDGRILEVLFENARVSIAELARRIGLSSPSTAERVKRLEESGVIEGYTITVNPALLGLPLPVCLRIRPVPGQMKKVTKVLNEIPEIVDCDRVTGDDCFIARAHVRSVKHMEVLIDRLTSIAMTNTAVIQTSPITRRLPAFNSPARIDE